MLRALARDCGYTCKLSICETEAGGSPCVLGKPRSHSEYQDSVSFREKEREKNLCLKIFVSIGFLQHLMCGTLSLQ